MFSPRVVMASTPFLCRSCWSLRRVRPRAGPVSRPIGIRAGTVVGPGWSSWAADSPAGRMPRRFHLLEAILPESGRGQAPVVDLPAEDQDPVSVDDQAVCVPGHPVRRDLFGAGRDPGRDEGEQDREERGKRKQAPNPSGR